jgi:hypothetical protein
MVTTIDNVIIELNDAPLFFEVSEDSITNYKNRTGLLPVMPLSNASIVLAPSRRAASVAAGELPAQPSRLVFPINDRTGLLRHQADVRQHTLGYSGGDHQSKFNYGVRLILNDSRTNPLLEHMPGMSDIVAQYNMVSANNQQINDKSFGNFVSSAVSLLRYAGQTRMYSTIFGATRWVAEPINADIAAAANVSTYQIAHGLGSVIDLTTNSDRKSSLGLLTEWVGENEDPKMNVSRRSSIIYNLLDLNISPINVHALRREIPLINIYNYAYTFDSFITYAVQSTYTGEGGAHDNNIIGKEVQSTHCVLSALLKNPYILIPRHTFYSELEGIVSGNSTLDLYGYPKFISDQIWSKVLLQDTVVGAGHVKHLDGRRRGAITIPVPAANNRRRFDRFNVRRLGQGMGNNVNGMPDNGYDPVITDIFKNKDGKRDPAVVGVNRQYLAELGRLRFDTKFARNLMFLANVQRIMLHKIRNELTEVHQPVATGVSITNRKLTDYRDGETQEDLYID